VSRTIAAWWDHPFVAIVEKVISPSLTSHAPGPPGSTVQGEASRSVPGGLATTPRAGARSQLASRSARPSPPR
jgi:hypothetical protein